MMSRSVEVMASFDLSIDHPDLNQSNGTIIVTAEASAGPFTVSLYSSGFDNLLERFNGAQGVITFDMLQAGTYIVGITDSQGCSTSLSAILVNKDCNIDIVLLDLIHATSCDRCISPHVCSEDGSITIKVDANFANPSITWISNSGATYSGTKLSNLSPGDYTVTISDGDGLCSISTRYTIESCSSRDLTLRGGDFICRSSEIEDISSDFTLNYIIGDPVGEGLGAINISLNDPNFDGYIFWVNRLSGEFYGTEDLYGVPAGSYCLNINSGCGDTNETCIEVPDCQNFDPSFSVSSDAFLECGKNTYPLTVTPSILTIPYTINIYDSRRQELLYETTDQGLIGIDLNVGNYHIDIVDPCGTVHSQGSIDHGQSQCKEVEYDRYFRYNYDDILSFSIEDPCNESTPIVEGLLGYPPAVKLNFQPRTIDCGSYEIDWGDGGEKTIIDFNEAVGRYIRIGRDKLEQKFEPGEISKQPEITIIDPFGCSSVFRPYIYPNYPQIGFESVTSSLSEIATLGYYGCTTCTVEGINAMSPSNERCFKDGNYRFRPYTYKPFDVTNPCGGGFFYYRRISEILGNGDQYVLDSIAIGSSGSPVGISQYFSNSEIFSQIEDLGCANWTFCEFPPGTVYVPEDKIEREAPIITGGIPQNIPIILMACSSYDENEPEIRRGPGGEIVFTFDLKSACGELIFEEIGDCQVEVLCEQTGFPPSDQDFTILDYPQTPCYRPTLDDATMCEYVLLCSADGSLVDIPPGDPIPCSEVPDGSRCFDQVFEFNYRIEYDSED